MIRRLSVIGSIPFLLALFYIVLLTPLMGRKDGYTVDANGSFRLTQAIAGTGQIFPKIAVKQGYTYSIVYLPFYELGGFISRFTPLLEADWVRRKCLCWMNTVITGLTVGLLSLTVRRLGFSLMAQAVVPLLYGLSTLAFCYARYDYNKCLTAFLLLFAFHCAVVFFTTRDGRYVWGCGMAAGLLLTVRLEMGIVVPVLLYSMARQHGSFIRRSKCCLGIVIPCLLGGGFVLFYNWLYWGGSAAGGYEGGFTFNPLPAVSGFFFSPGKSLWLFNPILLMLPLVVRPFHQRQPVVSSLWAGTLGGLFILYCFWGNWWGGWGFGPRHLVPLLPLAVLPLAVVVDAPNARLKVWLGFFALAGVSVQLLGSGVEFNNVIFNLMQHQNVTEPQLIWNPLWNPFLHHYLFITYLPASQLDFAISGLCSHLSFAGIVGILIGWVGILAAIGSVVFHRVRNSEESGRCP